jgi:hypothetical protein
MFSNSSNIAEVAIIYWRKLNCLLRILKIKEMGGAYAMRGKDEKCIKILFGKHERMRPLIRLLEEVLDW